jgi:hypothetical protein
VFEVSAADLKKFAAANDWPVGEFIDGADGSAEAATVLAKALEAGQLGKKTGKVKVFGSDVGVENVESADSSVNLLFPEL